MTNDSWIPSMRSKEPLSLQRKFFKYLTLKVKNFLKVTHRLVGLSFFWFGSFGLIFKK